MARKQPTPAVRKARKRGADAPPPPRAKRRQLPPGVREAIEADLMSAEQPAQNALARKHGVSPSTVGRIAKAISVSFDRSATETATRARVADIDAEGSRLVERMMALAHALMDTADQPYLVFNFGGKDNTYEEHTLDKPPIEALQKMQTIAAIATDKWLKVRKEVRGDGSNLSAFEEFLMFMGGEAPPEDETPED